jgi:hypothetical protein
MGKCVLDYDPVTKTTTYHAYDHSSKKTYIETVQDVESVLRANEIKRNSHVSSRFVRKPDWYHFATIPNTVLMEFKSKYNLDYNNKDDLPKIAKLLQSNEYYRLRTVDRI